MSLELPPRAVVLDHAEPVRRARRSRGACRRTCRTARGSRSSAPAGCRAGCARPRREAQLSAVLAGDPREISREARRPPTRAATPATQTARSEPLGGSLTPDTRFHATAEPSRPPRHPPSTTTRCSRACSRRCRRSPRAPRPLGARRRRAPACRARRRRPACVSTLLAAAVRAQRLDARVFLEREVEYHVRVADTHAARSARVDRSRDGAASSELAASRRARVRSRGHRHRAGAAPRTPGAPARPGRARRRR